MSPSGDPVEKAKQELSNEKSAVDLARADCASIGRPGDAACIDKMTSVRNGGSTNTAARLAKLLAR